MGCKQTQNCECCGEWVGASAEKPFKLELRSLWVDQLQPRLRTHQSSGSPDKLQLKAPSRATLMTWLTSAWEKLSTETLASGFRRLTVPNDTREVQVIDPVMQEAKIAELVASLESLAVAEEVREDYGLEFCF